MLLRISSTGRIRCEAFSPTAIPTCLASNPQSICTGRRQSTSLNPCKKNDKTRAARHSDFLTKVMVSLHSCSSVITVTRSRYQIILLLYIPFICYTPLPLGLTSSALIVVLNSMANGKCIYRKDGSREPSVCYNSHLSSINIRYQIHIKGCCFLGRRIKN